MHLRVTSPLSRRLRAGRARLAEERGVTMLLVLGTMTFTLLTLAAMLSYTTNDTTAVRRNIDQKQAYYAAQAALNIYAFRLQQNPNYWATCPTVSTPTAIPGSSPNEYYTFVPLPATTPCSESNMIDSAGGFRVAFTGYQCSSAAACSTSYSQATSPNRTIVATFKRASFLNFVYFTVYETIDPTADPAESSTTSGADSCYQDYALRQAGNGHCATIEFGTGDVVDGPLHSNDQVITCGTPVFGRSGKSDVFEDNGTPFCPGGGSNPTYNGPTNFSAGTESMPPNDTQLAQYASEGAITATYSGPTDITLSNNGTYTVRNAQINSGAATTETDPSNQVIYVNQSGNCQDGYTPFGSVYDDLNDASDAWYDPSDAGCGDAYVSGPYNSSLTIAAAGDIVIDGDLTTTTSGTALLGLIANNFVRVYRPINGRYADTWDAAANHSHGAYDATANPPTTSYLPYSSGSCGNTDTDADSSWNSSNNGPTIDAAILAITGSWIVDNYDCGANENNLNVFGAIAQVFRGPVETTGGQTTGYTKNYVYDDRLFAESPPHFLNPADAGWDAVRATVCYQGSSTNGCS
jgi:hypothetical protein